MDEIEVYVYPDNKRVRAWRYNEYLILVNSKLAYNSSGSIITDENGYRYKRWMGGTGSYYFQYRRI